MRSSRFREKNNFKLRLRRVVRYPITNTLERPTSYPITTQSCEFVYQSAVAPLLRGQRRQQIAPFRPQQQHQKKGRTQFRRHHAEPTLSHTRPSTSTFYFRCNALSRIFHTCDDANKKHARNYAVQVSSNTDVLHGLVANLKTTKKVSFAEFEPSKIYVLVIQNNLQIGPTVACVYSFRREWTKEEKSEPFSRYKRTHVP